MKWYEPLKFRNWGIVKVYRDIENYLDWVKTIKKEKANLNSPFNKWKLQHTKLYDVYTVVSLEEPDDRLPEALQRTKVIEMLNPLHRYLDDELKFAECLECDFNQFEDDQGKLTLSFLIVYKFRFNKLSLSWILKFLIVTGLIIFFILRFNLISVILSWV